jgi:hypothetical protein
VSLSVRQHDAQRAPVQSIELTSSEVLQGGFVWLRYQFSNR